MRSVPPSSRHAQLPTQWLDARDCLSAVALPNQKERTRVLSAVVQAHPDPSLNARLAAQGEVFITQGFIARDAHGRTVLLGRGGSDTSAAYFGALLKAERVEIWTDVAGMFSANPRQVPSARLLQRLDYEEAQEIATTGAKVLHPRCLSPLREPRVPLLIKDTNRPELEGTVIGPEVRDARAERQGDQRAQGHHPGVDGVGRHVAAGRLPRRRVRRNSSSTACRST